MDALLATYIPHMLLGAATWAICVRSGWLHDMTGFVQPTWRNTAIAAALGAILWLPSVLDMPWLHPAVSIFGLGT